MPRPRWMGETERNRVTFRLEGKALDEAQDDATIVTLREQEALGIDIVTDGEQRREGFIFHMCRTWDGIDLVNQVQKEVYRRRNKPRMVPRVTGKLKRRSAATVDDVKFAKAYTDRPVKMALAGPMTVIDSSLNDAYADEGEMAMDIAAAVNAELLDLQAAGCDLLQLDEPAMTRYHEKVFDYGAAALDRCLRRRDGAGDRASLLRLSRRRLAAAPVHLSRAARPADGDAHRGLHGGVRALDLRSRDPETLSRAAVHVRLHRSRQYTGADGRRGEAPHRRRARLSRSGAR